MFNHGTVFKAALCPCTLVSRYGRTEYRSRDSALTGRCDSISLYNQGEERRGSETPMARGVTWTMSVKQTGVCLSPICRGGIRTHMVRDMSPLSCQYCTLRRCRDVYSIPGDTPAYDLASYFEL